MARNALQILDDLGLLGEDNLLFISDNANENAPDGAGRANGLGHTTSTAAATAAVFGLDVAMVAPDDTPGAPDLSDLPDTGPFLSFDVGGTTVIDPQILSGKPKDGPGGGSKKPPKDDPNSDPTVGSE